LFRLPDPGHKGTPFCPGLAFPVGKPRQQVFPNRDKSTGVSLSQKVKKERLNLKTYMSASDFLDKIC